MKNEKKEKQCCDLETCDRDIVCYRGHIIPVNKVFLMTEEGKFERIDKVIKT